MGYCGNDKDKIGLKILHENNFEVTIFFSVSCLSQIFPKLFITKGYNIISQNLYSFIAKIKISFN